MPDEVTVNVPPKLKEPKSPGTLMPTPIVVLEPAEYVIFILPSIMREYRPPTFTIWVPSPRFSLATAGQTGPSEGLRGDDHADLGSLIMWMFALTGPEPALPSTATRARPPRSG